MYNTKIFVAIRPEKSYTQIEELYSQEVFSMSQRQLDIADMQCWIFRMAQSKWNISASECTKLFKKYDILGFISECYELLHVSSYENALSDVEDILKANGVTVCNN